MSNTPDKNSTFRIGRKISELLKAGFVQHASLNNLFTHQAVPGLLFRRVNNLAEAVSSGGVVCVSATTMIGYVGRTMWRALDGDRLGMLRLPKTLRGVVAGNRVPTPSDGRPKYHYDTYVGVDTWRYEQVIDPTHAGSFLMGIATRASDGQFAALRNATSSDILTCSVGFPAIKPTNANIPGLGPEIVLAVSGGAESSRNNVASVARGGFISMADDLPLREMLEMARVPLLETVDDKVRPYYASAYPVALDAVAPVGKKVEQQGPTLFLWSDGTWRVSAEYVSRVFTSVGNVGPHDGRVWMISGPPNVGVTGAASPVTSCAFVCTPHALISGDTPSDLPAVDFQIAPTDAPDKFWRVKATGVQIVDLTGVVQKTTKLTDKQLSVPTSAVVPRMLMMSRPAPAAELTDEVLDLLTYRKNVLARLMPLQANGLAVPTLNAAPTSAQLPTAMLEYEDALSKVDLRNEATLEASKWADQFVAGVLQFDHKLNELVRENIG